MNIGIDATSWCNNRGFGRFTRELLTALFSLPSDHIFYLLTDQPLTDLEPLDNVRVVQVGVSRATTEAAVANSNRSPLDMLKLGRATGKLPLDIMFFPAVYSWYPVPRHLPTMVTVHDAIAEHYPELIFPNRKSRLFWNVKVKWALRNCKRVLTVSRAARNEIVEYMGVDPALIDITSEAPNPRFRPCNDKAVMCAARERAGLPVDVPIIIYVGGLAPHKNLHGLLDGFEKAIESGSLPDVHLALIGDFKGAGFFSNYDSLQERVQDNPKLQERVHFTDYVSDEDLVALYSSALALAMPSYSEGFGLPAIEAMACAAPVLSSDKGSLPEVVGDAGVYFDPFDVDSIARAIVEMVGNEARRKQLSCDAVRRAGDFTWERAAQLTLSHLEQMVLT